ncbi:hypothetical protein CPAST_c40730 [Clostridium pasteurianum DSM 525 = ATCC 6013]|uniref:DUF2232 domain-containing protein n=1 Tax=Clostridium pasteurianum DSM 525 = ATCC 6013 TaxID=1262449 RepID=A0A0H3J9P8_CLOPA|nr:DUF2232 domain-containing protein [Clostridium pasteurianum]AJA50102.1 hypothetical protein CPAST_c40730 [Clostridium pasteurianum DSM 525 = ATCC 6013]AJA54090.1 hypothetical protein CLPA_c40730 [Clostridium pasteurianum DSM 525 = ATCC 6013]AOZ77218.1 hypothetical protein AQ983_19780 [Clostridium pasteurianum DSM 525 = ATCC 6013]AOZ81014.1 hypothetical protein AQ984_19775 [Clostridium pasteurianum]ELP59198.1 hypothetical protein F502_09958 [Clostridium pasteurianum DSM 525 = ATCC 6013]
MQNKNYNTRALVESAIMAAILIVTMFITVYVPIIRIITYLFLPTLLVLIYVRNGLKYALLGGICGFLVSLILINPITVLGLGAVIFIVGLTFIYCIGTNKKPYQSILILTMAFIITNIIYVFLITILVYKSGFVGWVHNMVNQINDSINVTKNMYINMGMDKEQVERALAGIESINVNQVLWMTPFYLIIMSLLSAFFNYKITYIIFSKIKIKIQELKGINYFFIPNLIGAFMIILLCLGLIFRSRNMIVGEYLFYSTYSLLVVILSINGIAAISYFLKYKLKFSNIFIVMTIILLFLVISYVFIIIGLVELIIDSRKLDPNRIRKSR